jgi:outer membrane protein OmpA-like peptidoglycan-associated protein
MKHRVAVLCLVMFAIAAVAQTTAPAIPAPANQGEFRTNRVETKAAPSDSDIYCSGFITNQAIVRSNYVVAGWQSPDAVHFSERDYVYLGGPGLQEGQEYTVVREIRDPNHYEAFPGQYRAIHMLGNPYADIARVKVISHRNKVAVAMVEFSCEPIAPGDTVVNFVERPRPEFRQTYPFDRFTPPSGKQMGHVVMARDFDTMFGTSRKVYLDIGADKGVQVGDYFRVVRSGDVIANTPIDAVSAHATMVEDTQAHPMHMNVRKELKDFPRRNLGDMIILNVYPKSAVAMVTFAFEDMHVGDQVEQEDLPPVEAPPPPPAPKGPTISCAAQPTSVQAGETSTITCSAGSPDNRPVSLSYQSDRGQLMPNGNYATLDTRNTGPGPIRVTATATDDRNLMASTNATVSVLAPPPPPSASKTSELVFKPKSSYVDNKAKALLDDLALRMQREGDAKVVVMGHADTATPAGNRLASARANNVKTYLTKDKGVDEPRITTRSSAGGDTAEIWWIPAGAQPPQ